MDTALFTAALCAPLLALASAGSALLSLPSSETPPLPAPEPWHFEGDLGRDLPGRALALTVSDTTRARALNAYRAASPTAPPIHLHLAPVHYGKVFGPTSTTDTYYLLARLTAPDGTPLTPAPHLWRRTGPAPWHHLGPRPATVPTPLRATWTSPEQATAPTPSSPCPDNGAPESAPGRNG